MKCKSCGKSFHDTVARCPDRQPPVRFGERRSQERVMTVPTMTRAMKLALAALHAEAVKACITAWIANTPKN